jgi:hypothetical protein
VVKTIGIRNNMLYYVTGIFRTQSLRMERKRCVVFYGINMGKGIKGKNIFYSIVVGGLSIPHDPESDAGASLNSW